MFGFLRSLFAPAAPAQAAREEAPATVTLPGAEELRIVEHLRSHHGYPIADWPRIQAWVERLDEKRRAQAWTACESAWLLHFRDAFGPAFRLDQSETAAIVSSLEPNVTRAALDYMGRTLRRIGAVLDGLVQTAPWGKDILIVFDDTESYYSYVSHYYPEKGEFAFSGGMHIDAGCGHYVTVRADLRQLEATIAHEMTHACLGHLPLPTWLNEGLAVNTERRLAGAPPLPLGALDRQHDRLRRFWSVVSIQEFWSGRSFEEPGESNELSYELARIVVEQLAKEWAPFREFVLRARAADAGADAARAALGADLGQIVTTLLERDTPRSWSPDPSKWEKK